MWTGVWTGVWTGMWTGMWTSGLDVLFPEDDQPGKRLVLTRALPDCSPEDLADSDLRSR